MPQDWNPNADFFDNSYVYNGRLLPISGQRPDLLAMRGSQSGVPQHEVQPHTSGLDPFAPEASKLVAYGHETAAQAPHHQPTFWMWAALAGSLIVLGHTATIRASSR